MAKETEQESKESDESKGPLEKLVVKNVPFVGTYYTRVTEVKHQSTIPSDLRIILMHRQGKTSNKNIVLFYSVDDGSDRIFLTDKPDEDSYADLRLARIDMQGRIVLPSKIFSKQYAKYVGRGSYIEVSPLEQPDPESQRTE